MHNSQKSLELHSYMATVYNIAIKTIKQEYFQKVQKWSDAFENFFSKFF